MTHWGWYWKVKKNHKAKALCFHHAEINSFDLFKNHKALELTKISEDRVVLEVPQYQIKATLTDDHHLQVTFSGGSYIIPVEKKPCNYGGFYHFFHCPECNARMRKLYLVQGKYLCRKCGDLKYYSQRLRPSQLALYRCIKIERLLSNRAGSLAAKPPWMKHRTFQALLRNYLRYHEKSFYETNKELLSWYHARVAPYLESVYFPPSPLSSIYFESLDENRSPEN